MESEVVRKNKLTAWVFELHASLTWHDYVFFLSVLVLVGINIFLLWPLKTLPSPLYGGDLYNHLGSMIHLSEGGSIFQNGQMLGEMQWVPWLYHALVVAFSKLTSISLIQAVLFLSPLLLVVGMTLIYFFASDFFQSKLFGLFAALMLAAYFPLLKYSPFAYYIVFPLFIYSAYLFFKKQSLKTTLFLGIMYGICGLSNTHVFIVSTFFLFVFFSYLVLWKNMNRYRIKIVQAVHSAILPLYAFITGFSIALLWWFKPIFVYHANTVNDMQIYGYNKTETIAEMARWLFDGIHTYFLNFSTFHAGFLSLALITGCILLFLLRKKNDESKFMLLMLIAAFCGLSIHFITIPFFGTHLGPYMIFDVFMFTIRILVVLFALQYIMLQIKDAYLKTAVAAVVAIILCANIYVSLSNFKNQQYYEIAKTELPPDAQQIAQWTLENTNLNDVFMTTNEHAFMLNALTGRKTLTYRRTHAPSYTDMNQRMLDQALILYGTNNDLRRFLIDKYQVKYLLWHVNWFGMEFQFDGTGRIAGFFDPLIIDYTVEREQMLNANGVMHVRQNYYLDPAWQPAYPMRDVLIIFPSQANLTHPWSPQLDAFLVQQIEINDGVNPIARIYEVRNDAVPLVQ